MANLIKKMVCAWKQRRDANTVQCFETAQKDEQAYDTIDRGTRTIAVDQIVGSVGRYRDFDDKFRLKSHVPSDRLQSITRAMLEGKSLPPVKLYQIKDKFYVLDGHHRISAAKHLKRDNVNACIVELLPSKNTLENILYREKVEFRDKTGLSAHRADRGRPVRSSGRQIEAHRQHLEKTGEEPVPFHTAAADWQQTIIIPFA